jgi:hypothetical protein
MQPSSRNTADTPVRSVRVGELWDRCAALAAGRRESMTTLVIRALSAEERLLRGQAMREIEAYRFPVGVFRRSA